MTSRSAVHGLPAGAPEPLQGRVVVVSPHCDDAVLSLGATLTSHVERGGSVTVVTPFAGDPAARTAAGAWDRAAGFTTAQEATRARRAEDRSACARLGLAVEHLDEVDEQYPRLLSSDELWEQLAPRLEGFDEVLLPGFPLAHRDHRAVTSLVLRCSSPRRRVRLYAEEPYALRERRPDGLTRDPWDGAAHWARHAVPATSARAKVAAARCYSTQLPLLAPGRLSPPSRLGGVLTLAQLWYLVRRGGEWTTGAVAAGVLADRLGTTAA